MDRLAQTALSALRQMQDNKFDLAHNLANVNVPGFRRDLPNEGNAGFLKELEKLSAKVLPLETEVRKFSNESGQLQNTGLETCLLYTSPSPRDLYRSRMPSSA